MSGCDVGAEVQVTGVVTDKNASLVQIYFGAAGCLWVEERLVCDILPSPPPDPRALVGNGWLKRMIERLEKAERDRMVHMLSANECAHLCDILRALAAAYKETDHE